MLHTFDKQLESIGRIKHIIRQLDNRFFLCEHAYIVNLDNIDWIDWNNNIIFMVNEEQCNLSIRKSKELKAIMKKKMLCL